MPSFGYSSHLRSIIVFVSLLVVVSPQAISQQQAPVTASQPAPQPQTQPQKPLPVTKPKKPAAVAAKKPADTSVDEKARLVEKIKDWTVFMHEDANGRICFAATMPTDTQPKAAKRTNAIFYLTNWQKDGIKNEVSIKQGYALKPNSIATATIGIASFNLAVDNDKTFVKDPNDERKIVAAMSAGSTMSIKTTNVKNVVTTDQYSLNGLPDAVKKLNEVCP